MYADIAQIQHNLDYIARAIITKVCRNHTHDGHPDSHKQVELTRATECVYEMDRLVDKGSDTVFRLQNVVQNGEARLLSHGPLLVATENHVGVISWIAAILAVLINIVCLLTLWLVCAESRPNRYRKLE